MESKELCGQKFLDQHDLVWSAVPETFGDIFYEKKSNLKYGHNLTENRNRVKIKLPKFRNIRNCSEFRLKI